MGRIGAGLSNGAPERKKFGGSDVDLLLLEEACRQSRPAQHSGHGDLKLLEPPGEEAGDFEPIANDFGYSHGFKITWIGDVSLATRANGFVQKPRSHLSCRRSPERSRPGTPIREKIDGVLE